MNAHSTAARSGKRRAGIGRGEVRDAGAPRPPRFFYRPDGPIVVPDGRYTVYAADPAEGAREPLGEVLRLTVRRWRAFPAEGPGAGMQLPTLGQAASALWREASPELRSRSVGSG